MAESYYRTGQAAKQLGVSSYHVRRLCEAGEIAAEISAGQQWKIPLHEVARLKKEGVPPVPAMAAEEDDRELEQAEEPEEELPSGRVVEAADDVKIAASKLQRRRLERESEEVEDWFRERQQRQALHKSEERQRVEAAQLEQGRQRWMHEWTAHALDSLPPGTPREVELDVHACVRQALAGLDVQQRAAITKRMVTAAVEKALRPWRRKQDIERALEAGMSRLAWEARHGAGFTMLKQRAWDAAVNAIRKAREDASYNEMAAATVLAVEPMVREFEHHQACGRVLAWIALDSSMLGASSDEQEAAKEAVRKALAGLPVGASHKQLEQAKEAALGPFAAAVARRKETQSKRRKAEWKADLEVNHVARYLEREYDFEGGYAERWRETERLRPLVREALVEELEENPEMSGEEIREAIEDFIDDEI